MFFRKFQVLTQMVGTMTLVLLALYGVLVLLEGNATTSWAGQQIAKVTGGAQNASFRQQNDSTVPLIINYQGDAEDHEGNPLTGYYTMTFRIYDDVIGTTTLWQEEHFNVTVRKGNFSVLLGNNTPLTNTLFTVPDRFIGVTVHPYDEMVPIQRFASVPYAMHSYHATKADHAFTLSAPDGEPKDALVVDNDGQVGIGTTSPSNKLEVAGKIEADEYCDRNGQDCVTSSVFSGMISPFNLTTCPTGWKPADGTNGTPDLRGQFIRGLNDFGTGVRNDGKQDPENRSLGSYQSDEFKSHTHSTVQMIGDNNVDGVDSTTTHSGDHHNEARETGATGGNETRPKNIALIYCVKN